MRVLLPFAAATLISAGPAPVQRAATTPVVNPLQSGKRCLATPMSVARKAAEKLQLKRLNKLPPAGAFAAVDHRIGGCPAPLTLTGQTFGR